MQRGTAVICLLISFHHLSCIFPSFLYFDLSFFLHFELFSFVAVWQRNYSNTCVHDDVGDDDDDDDDDDENVIKEVIEIIIFS